MHTEHVMSSQSFFGVKFFDFFSIGFGRFWRVGYGVVRKFLEAILRLPRVPFAILEINLRIVGRKY